MNLPMRRRLLRKLANRARQLSQYWLPEWRLARDPDWQNMPGLLQPWPVTHDNRHPIFFRMAAERLSALAEPRILSFGCATGEEVFALARLMPNALIDGIDINPACIAKAERRAPRSSCPRLTFCCAEVPPERADAYDAIFCLSVLRHARLDAERPESCADIFPFSRFETMVKAFDHALKPGGLLFLWGCNFPFAQTGFGRHYRTIAVEGKKAESGAFYGSNNRRIDNFGNREWVFEKPA